MTCGWPVDRDCFPALPAIGDDPDKPSAEYVAALAARNAAEDLAVDVLWHLSGEQFGICPVVVRPCPPKPAHARRATLWGAWLGTCGCGSTCTRSGPRAVHLPGPVDSIVTVTVGGVELAEADYVLEGGVLYRKGALWPRQDLGRPAGEPGTWTVEYLRGIAPPAGTAKFVTELAKEFLAACSGDDNCRLPRNITAVTRQGVSYQVYDPNQIYAARKTGLPEVDLWLSAINPNGIMRAPVVL